MGWLWYLRGHGEGAEFDEVAGEGRHCGGLVCCLRLLLVLREIVGGLVGILGYSSDQHVKINLDINNAPATSCGSRTRLKPAA